MRRPALFILLSVLALAVVAPGPALAKRGGTDRPVKGKSTSTTTVNLATGTGTSDGRGRMSHIGRFTFHNDHSGFTVTGNTFSWTQTATIVAANGDEIFTTAVGTGTLLPNNRSEATLISTITGGTGRFADASGTITSKIRNVVVSQVGTTITTHDTETHRGRVSY